MMIWLIIGIVLLFIFPPLGATIMFITVCVAIVKIATRPSDAEIARREEAEEYKRRARMSGRGYSTSPASNIDKLESAGYRMKR